MSSIITYYVFDDKNQILLKIIELFTLEYIFYFQLFHFGLWRFFLCDLLSNYVLCIIIMYTHPSISVGSISLPIA